MTRSAWSILRDVYKRQVFAGLHEEIADCVRVDAVVRYGYNGGYVGPVVHHGSNALDYNPVSYTHLPGGFRRL